MINNLFYLKGRVALVTGCSTGLGVQMARALAGQGANIVALPYHAAKGGVVNLTRALAGEWGKYGITVNSICPGYFVTPLTKETLESDFFKEYSKGAIPMERYGVEGELDTAAVFLSSPASSYVTGVALPVDGGYTSI